VVNRDPDLRSVKTSTFDGILVSGAAAHSADVTITSRNFRVAKPELVVFQLPVNDIRRKHRRVSVAGRRVCIAAVADRSPTTLRPGESAT
jgi:hypothetical protein